nr:hypothetical protein B0A51_09149 [Rachicladosporium sp. CCFEE 5018]
MDTSYLSQQVTTIIERLHGFFDEIGVPSHERDSRESELFSALSETLHNQLNLVAKEKHDLTEEARRLIKLIRQLERSIDNAKPEDDYSAEESVTYPLLTCIQALKEKHHTVAKLHRERYEQVKKLVEALESYASHLEPSFVRIKLPPTDPNAKLPPTFDLSPTYVASLDTEFTRVYEEYNKRLLQVQQTAEEIVNLWSELGTPQAQIDSHIVQCSREAPEQLGLHQEDVKKLTAKREKLIAERAQREKKLKELRVAVEGLWDRLSVDDAERRQFLAANRGCGIRQINEFEDELSRLNKLKRQNLHLFVEDARFRLQELWDSLFYSEEEMLEFAPAFSDVYSDALLSAHEQEIGRLEALKEQRAPIIAAVDRHRSLIKDREDLEKSSQDASRLMAKGQKGERRDPGKLLREEKMRKRITKDLPKVEAELRRTLEAWEDEYGRPFCVHGQRYLDELEAASAKAPPPRSKTPNALAPPREAPKSAGRPQPQSQSRAGTMCGPPPSRSKTPTASLTRNPLSASVMSTSMMTASVSSHSSTLSKPMSPSKIGHPGSRLPMSNLRDGNNSPERKLRPTHPSHKSEDLGSTLRGRMGPPARAPPPKMKDLFNPPTPSTTYYTNPEDDENAQRSASVIRHRSPEDPYDEAGRYRSHPPSYASPNNSHTSMPPPPRPTYPRAPQSQDSHYAPSAASSRPMSVASGHSYPLAPPSRQTSNTSSMMTGSQASGSENWESYTDASDTEDYQGSDIGAGRPIFVGGSGTLKRGVPSPVSRGGDKRVRDGEDGGGSGGWRDEELWEVY